MAKDTSITIKGMKGELLLLDAADVAHVLGDPEANDRATLVLYSGQTLKVPLAPLQIDHVVRKAKGLGLRPGVKLEKPNRKQRRAAKKAA